MLGVWSPGSEPPPAPKEPSPERKECQRDGGIPPVWTPTSAGASPVPEKKEFRPVQFESPILSRKKLSQQEVSYQDLRFDPFCALVKFRGAIKGSAPAKLLSVNVLLKLPDENVTAQSIIYGILFVAVVSKIF